jgi:hypothetical protein
MILDFGQRIDFVELDDNDVVQIEKEIITSYIKNNIDFISNDKNKDTHFKSNKMVKHTYFILITNC